MIRLHSETLWHQIKTPGIETNNFRLMSHLAARADTEELIQQFERMLLEAPSAAVRLGIMVVTRQYNDAAESQDMRELVADRAGEFLTMHDQLTPGEMKMAQFLISQLGQDPSPIVKAYLAESTDSTVYQ